MRYLVVLDFEANCYDAKFDPTEWHNGWKQEITEFPCVVIDVQRNSIIDDMTFHKYCKINEPVTRFATHLTGITQEMTDAGEDFTSVFKQFREWYEENFIYPTGKNEALIVTCGDWDLETMLPNQCELSKVKPPSYMQSWCNVKRAFSDTFGGRAGGMMEMLQKLDIEHTGRHHSGIDDCKNIAKICCRLIKAGYTFKPAAKIHT